MMLIRVKQYVVESSCESAPYFINPDAVTRVIPYPDRKLYKVEYNNGKCDYLTEKEALKIPGVAPFVESKADVDLT